MHGIYIQESFLIFTSISLSLSCNLYKCTHSRGRETFNGKSKTFFFLFIECQNANLIAVFCCSFLQFNAAFLKNCLVHLAQRIPCFSQHSALHFFILKTTEL